MQSASSCPEVPAAFKLHERVSGRTAVICVRGELDIATAPGLRHRLVVTSSVGRNVVVDLSACEFMDCQGLGALLDAQRHFAREGRCMLLAGARPGIRRLFDLTSTSFELATTAQVALARLADPEARVMRRRRAGAAQARIPSPV